MAKTVILVHGIYVRGYAMARLAHYFRLKGYKTTTFSYRTVTDNFEQSCTELAEVVRAIQGECIIVCHSLGGLITQGALKKIKEKKVTHVVSLGTPWQGAYITEQLKRMHIQNIVGKKLNELLPKKTENSWTDQAPLGSIAGSSSFGLGRLLMMPNMTESDGTVYISETKIAGMTDHIILPFTHTGMMLSKNIVNQCLYFVEHNSFKHS